jgi:hypothetical protein
MKWNPFDHHRGPYIFHVVRPHKRKPGFSKGEWLTGRVEREDIESEARALLDDPRDTIVSVSVYSTTEQQFVTTFTKRVAQAA